jgi:hypothetical protein
MKRQWWVVLLALSLATTEARAMDSLGFSRTCKVHSSPDPNSSTVCNGTPSDTVREMEKYEAGYYRVTLANKCTGYVTDSCLNLPVFRTIKRSEFRAEVIYQRFQVGMIAGGSLLFTQDPSSTTTNTGWGYEFGARVDIPVLERFRISPQLKYVGWNITRNLTPESAISAPEDLVKQNFTFVSTALSVGYTFGARYKADTVIQSAGNRTFWAEIGMELLYPVSASQQRNAGASVAFETSDKPLLIFGGLGMDWPLSDRWILGTHTAGFYNIAADSGSKLYGFRGWASLSFGLL